MTDENIICPLCGAGDVYVGITSIECGYDKNCKNWSVDQAKEVERISKVRQDSKKRANIDIKWDEDDSSTAPWSFGSFGRDDDYTD